MGLLSAAKIVMPEISKLGKLIGTGKNNGIKVYERFVNGQRILTSTKKFYRPDHLVKKGSEIVKEVKSFTNSFGQRELHVRNFRAYEKLDSQLNIRHANDSTHYTIKDSDKSVTQINVHKFNDGSAHLGIRETNSEGRFLDVNMEKRMGSSVIGVSAKTSDTPFEIGDFRVKGTRAYSISKEGVTTVSNELKPNEYMPDELGNVFKNLWEKYVGKV